MKFSNQVHKAIARAAVLHQSQTRKGDGYPYIVHPYSVAMILAQYTEDEEILIDGLLHDVLEDVEGYGAREMAATCVHSGTTRCGRGSPHHALRLSRAGGRLHAGKR